MNDRALPLYSPLLISHAEAQALSREIGSRSLMGHSLALDREALRTYMLDPLEIPGHGEAGGYEHNRHKQNYIHLNLAGRLFLMTSEQSLRDYATAMLEGYARIYTTLPYNTSRDTNPPGRLFHQTLNENMWLLYAAEAYSCIRDTLDEAQRRLIEDQLFLPMVSLFVDDHADDFDIVHNHGLWSVAAVGMCGYAIERQDIVDKALYGLKGDSVSGGFLAQLDQLFSPDGWYMEGPYYHRFALRPLLMFAEAIERRQPALRIYERKHQVIRRTSEALMSVAFPDGTLPALNDASRSMNIRDEGIVIATSLCFARYAPTPGLVAMAQAQGRVWPGAAGQALSAAAHGQQRTQIDWGSLVLRDGPDGERGGVAVLRQHDAAGEVDMALMWFGQHGSDHTLHDALDHGHYDGLHLSLFSRSHEFLQDYGFGRWVNVEPKFGGRYIPENDSYCKQTVAHNTVVVDESCQNGGDTATAEKRWGELHFFARTNGVGAEGGHPAQAMSARIRDYYPGVAMQRTVLMLALPEFERPLLLDLFRSISDTPHQYDYPLHYQGQVVRADFPYEASAIGAPLGERAGYQHLWHVAGSGPLPDARSALVTWLHDGAYHSMVSALPAGGEVIFARTGANDPGFNLRNEPALLLRVKDRREQLFATAYESHGRFDEATEFSVNARGRLQRIEIVGQDARGSVVRLHSADSVHTVMVSNLARPGADGVHVVNFGSEHFAWQGPFRVVSASATAAV